MRSNVVCALALATLLAATSAAQLPEDYLDVYMAKVKPDKRTEFNAAIKKMVDANRRHKGDHWIAAQVDYGEAGTVYFLSNRSNHAAVEEGFGAFMGAMNRAFTPAGAAKVFQDFNGTLAGGQSELRRRRWDLSANPPANPAALAKLIGETRWVRATMIHVRPGRLTDYEAQLRSVKQAAERSYPQLTYLVSQAVAGHRDNVIYVSYLKSSMGGFDTLPSLRQILGDSAFQQAMAVASDLVLSHETYILRFLPELSNPPEEVAAVAPDFWTPKPAPPPKPAKKKE